MSGQTIGTVVGGIAGGVIGFFAGGNVVLGAEIGMSVGGAVGGAVDPTTIKGPHIGDGQAQSATDGSPISWVMGTMWVAGTIVDVGTRREVSKKSGGKGGGPQTETYEAHQDFVILVCESDAIKDSVIGNVLAIEQDGKIVYDVRPGSAILSDSQKFIQGVSFYYGDESQLPPPLVETIHGAGNNPAYRGVLLAAFSDFNLTPAGDRIPQFRFLVTQKMPLPSTTTPGTDAWPQTFTLSAPGAGSYTLFFYTGEAPDDFQIWDGDVMLAESGWYGAQSYQSQLNSTLAAHGWSPATITTSKYPHGDTPAGGYDANFPGLWDSITFTKTSNAASITVKVYSVSPSGYGMKLLYGAIPSADLASLITAITHRGGLVPVQVNTSALVGMPVLGYSVAKQMSASDALSPLLGAYFAYASEYDGRMNFLFYGADAVLTIDPDDVVDTGNAPVSQTTRGNATEYPRRIIGAYYDPAQNYMSATVMATRRADGITATGDQSFQIPVVMPADQAQQAVDKAIKVAYAQLDGTQQVTVPFATASNCYLKLVPGDAVLYQGRRFVVSQETVGAGTLTLTLQADRQSAYTSTVQAVPGRTPTPPASRYSGPTMIIPMSLPQLRSQDAIGVYVVTYSSPHNPAWRVAAIQMSLDGGATWQDVGTSTMDGNIGTLTAADGGTSLVAQFTGDLSSVTAAQLDAGQNAAVLIHSTGAEVLQFGTATEDATTTDLYTLTDLRRAQAGTAQVTGAVGDQIVLLDAAQVIAVDTAYAGKTLQFRAVGTGETPDDATVASVVYQPDTSVIIDGGVPGDGLPLPGAA